MKSKLDVFEYVRFCIHTNPHNSRIVSKNSCGGFETIAVSVKGSGMQRSLLDSIRNSCLPCTRRTPELSHFATLEAASKGVVECSDICVCIAGWMIIVGKMAKCLGC